MLWPFQFVLCVHCLPPSSIFHNASSASSIMMTRGGKNGRKRDPPLKLNQTLIVSGPRGICLFASCTTTENRIKAKPFAQCSSSSSLAFSLARVQFCGGATGGHSVGRRRSHRLFETGEKEKGPSPHPSISAFLHTDHSLGTLGSSRLNGLSEFRGWMLAARPSSTRLLFQENSLVSLETLRSGRCN